VSGGETSEGRMSAGGMLAGRAPAGWSLVDCERTPPSGAVSRTAIAAGVPMLLIGGLPVPILGPRLGALPGPADAPWGTTRQEGTVTRR
jgi:hypothetical protein